MEYKLLGTELTPSYLASLSKKDRELLCAELRDKILNTVSHNGGHLGSNLGAVELTVSLLSVFDYTKDKIVFDVGHQSYSYKLLTGRFDRFDTLRQQDGISGFPRRSESPYDVFDTGHSSTSISAALGMARARDLKGGKEYVIAVIGDGAMTGGLAYEALNDLGHSKGTKMIVILNDNEMSIDKNVGGMSKYLKQLRISSGYLSAKKNTESFLNKIPVLGKGIIAIIMGIKKLIRFFVYGKSHSMFEDLGLRYYGPIDGHDTEGLIKAFNAVKDLNVPVLMHIVTKKGKGYEFAERNPSDYHGVGPFDIETGVKKSNKISYTGAFSGAMLEQAAKNKNVVGICAAMAVGTGMDAFSYKYPSRFFDCGIAEEHCVTMAGGMATAGMIPIVAIYSSFLQRAYDQILHDVCYMNNHVVFAIDRAGFVGNDGHTHNGIHDISYLNSMPGMTVLSPRDYTDLKICFDQAVNKIEGPVAIRYPRGASPYEEEGALYKDPELMYKPHIVSDEGDDYVLITTGLYGKVCDNAARILSEKGYKGRVICLTVLKPLNTSDIMDAIGNSRYVFTGEEGILSGGFGESLKLELTRAGYTGRVDNFAIEDQMIRAGTVQQQLQRAGLDAQSVSSRIEAVITEAVK
ncbi:MAG: 1-deoxy-D-xylulose-5-phosphate synthase [Clostridiales bacterium]|nr:1-deoxy-D-xylulose-5-phosphate synthase [Clostridiales bacterium]